MLIFDKLSAPLDEFADIFFHRGTCIKITETDSPCQQNKFINPVISEHIFFFFFSFFLVFLTYYLKQRWNKYNVEHHKSLKSFVSCKILLRIYICKLLLHLLRCITAHRRFQHFIIIDKNILNLFKIKKIILYFIRCV